MTDVAMATDADLLTAHRLAHHWHDELAAGHEVIVLEKSLSRYEASAIHDELQLEIEKRRRERDPGYAVESKKIALNQKGLGAKPHDFVPAEWTFPNGHPRCLMCGDEERSPETTELPGKCLGYVEKSTGDDGNEVAIPIAVRDGMVLMGYKREGQDPLFGKLILPGGHVEDGEDVGKAAVRELEEETAVGGMPVKVLGTESVNGNKLTFVLVEPNDEVPTESAELMDVAYYAPEDAASKTLPSNMKWMQEALSADVKKRASPLGQVLSSRVHKTFTKTADDLAGLGYMNTEQRIALSSAIGQALNLLDDKARELGLFDVQIEPDDVEELVLKSLEPSFSQLNEVELAEDEVLLELQWQGVSVEAPTMPGEQGAFSELMKAVDEEEQIVYGPVLVPAPFIDLQKDLVRASEIRKAAHSFMSRFQGRNIGDMHVRDDHRFHVVESYLAPTDFELQGTDGQAHQVTKGTWVMAVKVNDPAEWQLVKQGARTGFSIEGKAKRIPRKRNEVMKEFAA